MAEYNVVVASKNHIIVKTGVQGPPGVGAGTAIVQDHAPLNGALGQLWFNDNTQSLTVFAQSSWMNQAMDGGYY